MTRKPYRHILVPTDGSKLALKGVKAAVTLARALGARVRGLYVAPAPMALLYDSAGMHAAPMLFERVEKDTSAHADRALQAVSRAAQGAGVRCAVERLDGARPWQGMLEVARKRRCDLIVLASHGRNALGRLLHGSQTARLLSRTDVPVLVVR